jgi:hypothetical protein
MMRITGTNMKDLTFPKYRIVGEFTPDEQLGRYRYDLWIKVEKDITDALKENSEVYDEVERKIFS